MCDSILLSKSATSNTVAISGLHVIKAHPEYLKKYIYSYSKTFINLFFYILKGIYFYCTYFIKNFFTKKVRYLNTKKKIIIISHLLSPGQIKKEKDLYFGDLQKVLGRKKFNPETTFALRIGSQIKEYVKKYNPKFVYVPTKVTVGREWFLMQ